MNKKVLSAAIAAVFCISLSACSFSGLVPLDKIDSLEEINPFDKKQSGTSSENSESAPVYRLTKEIYDGGEIVSYTYNPDGTICSYQDVSTDPDYEFTVDVSFEYYDDGTLKTLISDRKGDVISEYDPNHMEIHCDETGAFESVESSVDREMYELIGVPVPVYEIEVTGEREICVQGYRESDADTTFVYKRRYTEKGDNLTGFERQVNGELDRAMERTMNELGLPESASWQDADGSESVADFTYVNDANGNPIFCIEKYDNSSESWFGTLFFEDINGTDSATEAFFDETNAEEYVRDYFGTIRRGDSQNASKFVYRPLQELYDLLGGGSVLGEMCDDGQLFGNEALTVDITSIKKAEDLQSYEREAYDLNTSFAFETVKELNGVVVRANVYTTEDRSEETDYYIILGNDGAGEKGILAIEELY